MARAPLIEPIDDDPIVVTTPGVEGPSRRTQLEQATAPQIGFGSGFEPGGIAWVNDLGAFLYRGGTPVNLMRKKIQMSKHPLKLDRYMEFNGVDGYVRVANDVSLNFGANTDFSLEIIFRTSTKGSNLINKGDWTSPGYWMFITGAGTIQIFTGDGGNTASSIGSTDVTDGAYHQAISTFDRDGDQNIYIDGNTTPEDTDDMSGVGNIDEVNEPLTIGIRSENELSDPYTGDIALVRIYNRALAPKEIEQHYNFPNGGAPTPLLIGGDFINADFDTFTVGGNFNITQAVAGSANDNCYHLLSAELDPTHRYVLSFTLTMNSGDVNDLRFMASPNSSLTSADAIIDAGDIVAGDNSVTYTPTQSGLDYVGFRADAALDFAAVNVYLTDLDALTAFPLAVDQWGEHIFTSDFSAGADSWTADRGAVVGNIDSIGGRNDNLRFTDDGTSGSNHRASVGVSINDGFGHNFTFDIYIPSTNSNIDGIRVDGAFTGQSIITPTPDTWVTVSVLNVSAAGSFVRLTAADGATVTFQDAGADDVFYIRNVQFAQAGAVAHYEPKNIDDYDYKWDDSSSNNLHGLLFGATPIMEDAWETFYTDNTILGYDQKTNTLIIMRDCTGEKPFGDAWMIDLDKLQHTTGRRMFEAGAIYSNFEIDWKGRLIVARQTSTSVVVEQFTDEPQEQAAGLIKLHTAEMDFGTPELKALHGVTLPYKSSGNETKPLSYVLDGDLDFQSVRLPGNIGLTDIWKSLTWQATPILFRSIKFLIDNPTAAAKMEFNDLGIQYEVLKDKLE